MAANTRYYRFNCTATGTSGSPGTSLILQELQLQNTGGDEVNAIPFGASITGPTPTSGTLNNLMDSTPFSGTACAIPVPFSTPIVIDMGSGRGTGSGDAITSLVINPQAAASSNAAMQAALPRAFTLDSGTSPTGPWTNYITVTADDVTTGYGAYTSPTGKSFAVGSPTVGGSLAAGTATTGSVTSSSVAASATEATGGTSPYAHQWMYCATSGGTYTAVSGQTTLNLSATGLSASTTGYYQLRYTDAASAVVYSNTLTLTTAAAGTPAPTPSPTPAPTPAPAPSDVWDTVIDGTYTARQLMRLIAAALLGKSAGQSGPYPAFRDLADTKNRVTATLDNENNRVSVTLDPS